MKRFPNIEQKTNQNRDVDYNLAIRLFGRRFYKDQTPVEYLAEFLLVFASSKIQKGENMFSFPTLTDPTDSIEYWPEDKISLKFFSFFATSKLETRHPVHQKSYRLALQDLKNGIDAPDKEKNFTIRLLQSLFGGFVGVAQNRTWATHTFLPITNSLLSREVGWRHKDATKGLLKSTDWDESTRYFELGAHNFMARGGESLFLQLSNLFSTGDVSKTISDLNKSSYKHLVIGDNFQKELEQSLKATITNLETRIGGLSKFIENKLNNYSSNKSLFKATMGWIPQSSQSETLLFASELFNISHSSHGVMHKIEAMQDLCCLQVLRSLCFQSRRLGGDVGKTEGFAGNYAWIASAPNSSTDDETKKLAQQSYHRIEQMLYRVLRIPTIYDEQPDFSEKNLNNADDQVYKLFRKLSKEIGFVVPKTGTGMRFTLPNHLVCSLAAALIKPGDRIRLDEFYRRIYAHFGIAIGSKEIISATNWLRGEANSLNIAIDSTWFEEELQRGGFLIALSDAVSMVINPHK